MTLEATVHVLLNLSLMASMLLAPSTVLIAWWYRQQFSGTMMVWKKPELVILTILYSAAALVLFIVGFSCFVYYIDYENRFVGEMSQLYSKKLLINLAALCALGIAALSAFYAAARMLFVQVITHHGIILNDRLVRIPDYRNTLKWESIADYYLTPDYPNAIYTLIVRTGNMKFERISLRVPMHLQEAFEDILDDRMFHGGNTEEGIGRARFWEN